jgi:hypothetical protein
MCRRGTASTRKRNVRVRQLRTYCNEVVHDLSTLNCQQTKHNSPTGRPQSCPRTAPRGCRRRRARPCLTALTEHAGGGEQATHWHAPLPHHAPFRPRVHGRHRRHHLNSGHALAVPRAINAQQAPAGRVRLLPSFPCSSSSRPASGEIGRREELRRGV